MVATGGVLGSVVNVNASQALQSLPSDARIHIVSEPATWPPRIVTVFRSEALTSIETFAPCCGVPGVEKYALVAAVPPSQNSYMVAALFSASTYETKTF
jgi:hypothetical protein